LYCVNYKPNNFEPKNTTTTVHVYAIQPETMTRYSTIMLLLLAPLSASAFTVLPSQPSTRNPSTTAVFMSDSVETSKLVLTGNNIELTQALEDYAEKRIGGLLDKLGSGGLVRECDIHLSVSKNPSVRIQTKKTTIRSKHHIAKISNPVFVCVCVFVRSFVRLLYAVGMASSL